MFTAVLIDDEPKNNRILKKLLSDFCPDIHVVGEAGDVESAYQLIASIKPAIVFLDIEMPYGNAFDLLDRLVPVDFEVIFITAFNNYSIKAFRYSALDYLLKPVNINELQAATRKATERISQRKIADHLSILISNMQHREHHLQKMAVPTIDGFVFLQISDIIYFEANGAYTYLHISGSRKILASRNIKEYEEMLPPEQFFRIHNSYMVNLNKIVRYNKGRGGTVTMENGVELEVATRRRTELIEKFKS